MGSLQKVLIPGPRTGLATPVLLQRAINQIIYTEQQPFGESAYTHHHGVVRKKNPGTPVWWGRGLRRKWPARRTALQDPRGSQHKKPFLHNFSSQKLSYHPTSPPYPTPNFQVCPRLPDAPATTHPQQLRSGRGGTRCGEAPAAAGAPDQLLLRPRRLRMCETSGSHRAGRGRPTGGGIVDGGPGPHPASQPNTPPGPGLPRLRASGSLSFLNFPASSIPAPHLRPPRPPSSGQVLRTSGEVTPDRDPSRRPSPPRGHLERAVSPAIGDRLRPAGNSAASSGPSLPRARAERPALTRSGREGRE